MECRLGFQSQIVKIIQLTRLLTWSVEASRIIGAMFGSVVFRRIVTKILGKPGWHFYCLRLEINTSWNNDRRKPIREMASEQQHCPRRKFFTTPKVMKRSYSKCVSWTCHVQTWCLIWMTRQDCNQSCVVKLTCLPIWRNWSNLCNCKIFIQTNDAHNLSTCLVIIHWWSHFVVCMQIIKFTLFYLYSGVCITYLDRLSLPPHTQYHNKWHN